MHSIKQDHQTIFNIKSILYSNLYRHLVPNFTNTKKTTVAENYVAELVLNQERRVLYSTNKRERVCLKWTRYRKTKLFILETEVFYLLVVEINKEQSGTLSKTLR